MVILKVLLLFYSLTIQNVIICEESDDDIYGQIWDVPEDKNPENLKEVSYDDDSMWPDSFPSIMGPNGPCECLPYYLCTSDTFKNKKNYTNHEDDFFGEGVINVRSKPNIEECPHYLLKCCDEEDVEEPEPTTTAVPTTTTTTTTVAPPSVLGCGLRSLPLDSSHASDSQFGEFPWTTAIYYLSSRKNFIYVCGGSLIHPSVVLSAAHCIREIKGPARIRIGEWDSRNENEKYPHQDIEVASITRHKGYLSGTLSNDIALFFLSKPVSPAPHINTICIPTSNLTIQGKKCTSSGWGRESFGKEGLMTKIEVPLVPRGRCQAVLRRSSLGRYYSLDVSFLCAGGEEGKDTCKGDGGSPLVCGARQQGDKLFQVGIVSWGVGCGQKGVPGVYVNVGYFRGWIEEKMKKKGFVLDGY